MAYLNNPENRKKETAGWYGTDLAYTHKTLRDFTANSTVYSTLPTPFDPRTGIQRLSFSIQTAGADADGTMLIRVQKVRGGSGGTVTNLTGQVSVESNTVTFVPGSFDIPFLSTLTPQDFTLLPGDALRVEQVSNSAAIDTQPVDLSVLAEFAVIQPGVVG